MCDQKSIYFITFVGKVHKEYVIVQQLHTAGSVVDKIFSLDCLNVQFFSACHFANFHNVYDNCLGSRRRKFDFIKWVLAFAIESRVSAIEFWPELLFEYARVPTRQPDTLLMSWTGCISEDF